MRYAAACQSANRVGRSAHDCFGADGNVVSASTAINQTASTAALVFYSVGQVASKNQAEARGQGRCLVSHEALIQALHLDPLQVVEDAILHVGPPVVIKRGIKVPNGYYVANESGAEVLICAAI